MIDSFQTDLAYIELQANLTERGQISSNSRYFNTDLQIWGGVLDIKVRMHCTDGCSLFQTYLKDTFNQGSISAVDWPLVQGGHVAVGCQLLADGPGLHFTGLGQRQAMTRDLDLRNARFIQYKAMIGGPSTRKECGTPKTRNESIILQYSVNGGMTATEKRKVLGAQRNFICMEEDFSNACFHCFHLPNSYTSC